MAGQSISDVVSTLGECQLLRPDHFQELNQKLRQRFVEPKALLRSLVDCGWLTPYQVKFLLQGLGSRLVRGPYVILEQLGEGGMGQVFKARQQSLQRVVALKVMRQELVCDSEAVGRFYREIKVASQLPEHPNLVRAIDAGPLGTTHFLAMEYVAGTDLERLVKQSGPLTVAQASDFLRQAALGLQHAHQHGLVHRDIKPSNLLVSPQSGSERSALDAGLVKILDLGLARLHSGSKTNARENTFLTADGPVTLGTIDYQAPEQALDFHRADIRADIYSLGCTSYYLLTGKPPFGSGPLAIKLMRHQQAAPPDLRELRSDVPAGLAAIVRRMLTKRPGDRYQTPGAVAEALASLTRSGGGPSLRSRIGVPGAGILSKGLAATARLSGTCVRASWRQAKGRPRLILPMIALSLLLMGAVAFFSIVRRDEPKNPDPAADAEAVRQTLLAIRRERPGSLEARASIEEFMKLPSFLDRLDPKTIPPDARLPGDPKELVAVFGKPGQKRVQSVAFSPDGRLLACGDSDNQVRLWDLATGEERATLKGHPSAVFSLAFHPDGKTLASGGGDVRFWDVATGNELALQKPAWNLRPSCMAYSPDGKTLAVACGGAGVLQLWDVAAGRERVALKGLSDLVFSLAFAVNGQTVAVASYQHPVKVWNVADGAERPSVPVDNAYCVEYTADGQTLVVVGPEAQMKLWDIAGNRERSTVPITVRYDRLALAPDGRRAVTTTSGGGITVWSLSAGTQVHQWRLPTTAPVQYHFTFVPAFAPDGRHIAVAGDNGKVYIFRLPPQRAGK